MQKEFDGPCKHSYPMMWQICVFWPLFCEWASFQCTGVWSDMVWPHTHCSWIPLVGNFPALRVRRHCRTPATSALALSKWCRASIRRFAGQSPAQSCTSHLSSPQHENSMSPESMQKWLYTVSICIQFFFMCKQVSAGVGKSPASESLLCKVEISSCQELSTVWLFTSSIFTEWQMKRSMDNHCMVVGLEPAHSTYPVARIPLIMSMYICQCHKRSSKSHTMYCNLKICKTFHKKRTKHKETANKKNNNSHNNKNNDNKYNKNNNK